MPSKRSREYQPIAVEVEYFNGEKKLLIGIDAEDFIASLPLFSRYMITVVGEIETANDDRLKRVRILKEEDWEYIEWRIGANNA